jgi:hypothetical protein
VEKWGKEKERRVPAAVFGRATPLTAAGQAAGRGEEAGRPPPVLCWAAGGGGENEGILGFQGSSALYTPPISVGAFSSVDLRSTAAMHQRPRGLISAQAGGSAGPLCRPSRKVVGPGAHAGGVGRPRAGFSCWAEPADREQYQFLI